MRIFVFVFIALLIGGCAAQRPMVRIEEGYRLMDYKSFEVAEAKNDTDLAIPKEFLQEIKKRLEVRLSEKGLFLNRDRNEKKGIILLRNILISYDTTSPTALAIVPGSKNECIIQIELIDKKTNLIFGEFIARGTTMGGGLIALSLEPEVRIIDSAAKSFAEEIARQMEVR